MLFDDDVSVSLTKDEWAIVNRPITGDGGAQGLLEAMLDTETKPRQLLLTYVQLDRAYHYAYAYGGGGFQDRFRAVYRAALRTGQWSPPDGLERKRKRPGNGGAAFGHAK